MKNLLVLILAISCGCSFALGEASTKAQSEIPSDLLAEGPVAIEDIKRYLFDPGEVTLSFIIAGASEGEKISFLVTFSRSAKLDSRACLRIKEGKNTTDYQLDLGSEFAQRLAKRVSLKLPEEPGTHSPGDPSLRELGPSRIKALRTLLEGDYSWKNPPK